MSAAREYELMAQNMTRAERQEWNAMRDRVIGNAAHFWARAEHWRGHYPMEADMRWLARHYEWLASALPIIAVTDDGELCRWETVSLWRPRCTLRAA